jgi:hypothetical protein
MPNDSTRLKLNFGNVPTAIPVRRIGGAISAHPMSATDLVFFGDGVLYTYWADILVVDPATYALRYPSVLGQEIWRRWKLTICYPRNEVEIDAITVDETNP